MRMLDFARANRLPYTWRETAPPDGGPAPLADELYLSILTRLPAPEEAKDVADYLARRSTDRPVAVQELIWALLTSTEFRFNH